MNCIWILLLLCCCGKPACGCNGASNCRNSGTNRSNHCDKEKNSCNNAREKKDCDCDKAIPPRTDRIVPPDFRSFGRGENYDHRNDAGCETCGCEAPAEG